MSDASERSRYGIEQSLAKGGMGEVLSARDLHLDRSVAMKLIREDHDASKDVRLRFVQEARILARLEHPNIVPVHDLDKDEQGRVFYTMKLVQGVTLREVINRLKAGDLETVAKYPLSHLLTVFQKVCDAMAYAHSRKIVHRDLKPENLMLGEYGEVLVMDWGLAKVLGGTPADPADTGPDTASTFSIPEGFKELEHLPGGNAITLEGQVMGTPQFMAPEQAAGDIHKIDERSDVFSLGAILYSLLSLRPPTGGSSVKEVLENVTSGYVPPPIIYNKHRSRAADGGELITPITLAHCPDQRIPDALSAVCMKAMSIEQHDRYQTVRELQEEISAYQGGFATGAEGAGAIRQMWLLVKRHKTTFALTTAGLLMTGAVAALLTAKIVTLTNKSEGIVIDLKKTIPLQRAEIQKLIDGQQFDAALEKVEDLLKLDATTVDWHILKGNLLQTQLHFGLAQTCYKSALELDPQDPVAKENLQLCADLLRSMSGRQLPPVEDLERLQKAMTKQQRSAESLVITKLVGEVSKETLAHWRGVLDKAGVKGTLELDTGGFLSLDLNKQGISDLTVLKGAPLSRLINLGNNNLISDLSPLKGMPLRVLSGGNWTKLKDLSPLAGMPLQSITFYVTQVGDLTPLKGMPLNDLSLFSCRNVSDLSPLRGLPLTYLRLGGSGVSDLSPLEGMKLTMLEFSGSKKVSDLTPLKNMPLRDLRLSGCNVRDISVLKGIPASKIYLSNSPVTNISVLSSLPLIHLYLDGCTTLTDISPLVECSSLTFLVLPLTARNTELLRDHPKIKRLTYEFPEGEAWSKVPPVAEFWKAYDAKKGRQK